MVGITRHHHLHVFEGIPEGTVALVSHEDGDDWAR